MTRIAGVLGVAVVVGLGCGSSDGRDSGPMLPDTGIFVDAGPGEDGGPTCAVGETRCEEGCVRTDRDDANCGSCGNVCAAGTHCAGSTCSCLEPMLACDGVCIDPMT